MLYSKIIKPMLFRMDAEQAHHFTIGGLQKAAQIPGMIPLLKQMYSVQETADLAVDLWGLHFASPIGLAAGLDKNGSAVAGLSAIGFGFMEVGTVTPLPQAGNDQPRLFRLPPDRALINRMGFNNVGITGMAENLTKLKQRSIPLAINVGKNKLTPNDRANEDYTTCIRQLYPYGDLFVINVSSPNTPDLRSLQHGDELRSLLAAAIGEMDTQHKLHGGSKKPILIKLAPDISDQQFEPIIETIAASGVSGIIATNTTLSRDGLKHANAGQAGGLSGAPLLKRSTEVIRTIYRLTSGKLPIIGSGGIFNAQEAYDKIRAGASLIEIYTGLIYQGPIINRQLHHGIRDLLRRDGFKQLCDAVGVDN